MNIEPWMIFAGLALLLVALVATIAKARLDSPDSTDHGEIQLRRRVPTRR